MSKVRIHASDGHVYEIDAPDGMSDADIQHQFEAQMGGGDAAPAADAMTVEGGRLPHKGEEGFQNFVDAGYGVDPNGELIKPENKPTSQTQGFVEGFEKPFNNVAQWAESGLNMLGGLGDTINKFGADYLGTAPSVQAAVDKQAQDRNASPYQSGGIGKFAGEVVGTALASRLPGGVLSKGAQAGALLSDDPNNALGVATDAATGAVTGAVGDRVIRGAARLASPIVSPAIRTLIDAGIRPTSGQIAGAPTGDALASVGGRAMKKVEDVVASVPIAGAAVQNAQYRGVIDLNRAVANRALGAIGARLPEGVAIGQDSIRYTGDRLSQAYNEVLPRLNGRGDNAFANRIRTLVTRADLPEQYQGQIQSTVNEALKAFRPRTPITGNDTPITFDQIGSLPPRIWEFNGRRLRDASERLGDLASGWRRSDDPYMRIMGDVATGIREQLHALARRQNPEAAATLRDIDRGYATLVRAERAAGGTADGIFTPRQYDSAVRNLDGSARRRQSARGLAFDQDLSGAASRVMANTASVGGSKDVNSLVALGVLGTRAAGGDPFAIGGLGAVAGGSAAYTQTGQAALRAAMTRNTNVSPELARLLQYLAPASPYALPAAIGGASGYLPSQ